MNFEDQTDPEVLISSNNVLSKAEKEKEKELQRFHDTSNTFTHKIVYATIY